MIKTVYYAWRLVSTAFSYLVFGVGGLLISYLWLPLVRLIIHSPDQRRVVAQYTISLGFDFMTRLMQRLGLIRVNFNDLALLHESQGCVVVANHPTLIDVVLMIGRLRQCDCIVKAALWNNYFLKEVISMAGYIPNNADDLLQRCSDSLAAGRKILVFPEGTRTDSTGEIHCQRGAAQMIVRCSADLQRVTIQCYPLTLMKEEKWYQIPAVVPTFTVTVYPLEKLDNILPGVELPSLAARKLTQYFNRELKPL